MSSLARPELLASTEWLAESLGRPQIRILDVRWRPDGTGASLFSTGHIPRAVHLDWRAELCDTEEGDVLLLAGPEQFEAAMERVGIGDGTTVVVYDDTASLYASRTWWSLRAYGFESARVLDGGFGAWTGEGRQLSNATLPPEHAAFTPQGRLRVRLTTTDVRGLLGAPDVQIVDARAGAEYRGQEGNARRLGHIPGALNLPVAALTVPGTQRFRGGDELRAMIQKAGIARGRRIVCYDGSGIAAAKLAYILALVGFDDVAVYDGGWAEWGNRLDLPVDR